MDEEQKTKLTATCSCGSGKEYGLCCGTSEDCFCGSGKEYGSCCGAKTE